MSLFNKLGLFAFWLVPVLGFGQQCQTTITGTVVDESTGIPLPYGTVFIQELQVGVASDSLGRFQLKGLCKGAYHLQFNHIGCETHSVFISVVSDTTVEIAMHHHSELVDEVVIHDNKSDHTTQMSSSIGREAIKDETSKDLSIMLEQMVGVSSIKTGAGVSKPVIHGLSGNRVTILNNGIAQSGQQWGNDHAPEIDPFVADHISVVKGASALAYAGGSLGGVVLVEPDDIENDPHLHGEVNYIFQTNGLGHTLNARLQNYAKWAAWRVSATAKVIGDRQTPNYYLTNTGKREYNLALQMEKKLKPRWRMKLYYSFFNTEIGILRGSHIGNLTDLQEAFLREEPFFTSDAFSYSINQPRQMVQHHLLKLESQHILNEHQSLNFKYGGQLNNRQEFDVRRSGRSDSPALSLFQWDHFIESMYRQQFGEFLQMKIGAQFRFTDNTNNPETGILPLLPDYRAYRGAAFAILQRDKNKLLYEIGARYDLSYLQIVGFSTSVPRTIERNYHTFHNYGVSGGMRYKVLPQLKLSLDVGHVLRSPEVNELYSAGLHQGVSGIEEGNRNLGSERSTKVVLSADGALGKKLFVQVLGYYQFISNFIYLQPQPEFRLTIRGAFPLFSYQQTDATLAGADVLLSYEPIPRLRVIAKYAFLRGIDSRHNLPLIYMPANNLFGSIAYSFKDGKQRKNTAFTINGRYVFKQENLNADQDYLPAPDGYFLLGASLSSSFSWKETSFKCSLNAENMLNTTYRDYLNRQRYFANDLGWNLSVRVNYLF